MCACFRIRLGATALLAFLYLIWPPAATAQEGGLWTLYSSETTEGELPSSEVEGVFPIDDGVLAITQQDAVFYDGHQWTQARLPLMPKERINTVAMVSNPTAGVSMWLGTSEGILVSGGPTFPTVRLDFGRFDVAAIFQASDDSTWIGTSNDLKRLMPDGTLRSEHSPPVAFILQNVTAMEEDASRDVWIGTHDSGLYRFDGAVWSCFRGFGEPFLQIEDCAPILPGELHQINALADDGEDGVWVGTENGLVHMAGLVRIPLPEHLAAETSGRRITALWRSQTGELWIGLDNGLLRYEGKFVRSPPGSDAISLGTVRAIRGDGDGNVWIATQDGVWRYRDAWEPMHVDTTSAEKQEDVRASVNEHYLIAERFLVPIVRGSVGRSLYAASACPQYLNCDDPKAILFQTMDELWFGAAGYLIKWTPKEGWGKPLRFPAGVSDDLVPYSLISGSDGQLWIGTTAGLWHVNLSGDWSLREVDGLKQQPIVYTLVRDHLGRIWAGTSYGVLLVQDDRLSLFDIRHGLNEQTVRSLFQDRDGQLWVGQHGVGRWKGNVTNEDVAFEEIPALAPMNQYEIVDITQDTRGWFWYATNRGAWVYDPKSERLWRYTMIDGLVSNDVRKIYADGDGRVWLDTAKGIQRYSPGPAPPWISAELSAKNQLVKAMDSRDTFSTTLVSKTSLAWDQTIVQIRLDGGDLATNAEALRFCYWWEDQMERICADGSQILSIPITRTLRADHDFVFWSAVYDKDQNSSKVSLPIEVGSVPLARQPWFPGAMAAMVFASIAFLTVPKIGRSLVRYPYLDVAISLRPAQPDGYLVEWQAASSIGGSTEVRPVYSGQLWEAQGFARYLNQQGSPAQEDVRRLGEILFGMLFTKEQARHLKDHLAVHDASRWLRRRGVRLRLVLQQAPELAGLPWETVYDPEIGFLGQRRDIALVRHYPSSTRIANEVKEVLRVLVVMAQPAETQQLDLPNSRNHLETVLSSTAESEVEFLCGYNAAAKVGPGNCISVDTDLPSAIAKKLREGWDVLHFDGHAGQDRQPMPGAPPSPFVLWCEDERGDYMSLSLDALGEWIEALAAENRAPRVVVLNACETAGPTGSALVSLLERGVNAAVGMQRPLQDTSARAFSEGFYTELVRSGQVDHAVSQGRERIVSSLHHGQLDWSAPVLVTKTERGIVFTPKHWRKRVHWPTRRHHATATE